MNAATILGMALSLVAALAAPVPEADLPVPTFSPNGKLLASGSSDTTGLIWDVSK